MQWVTRTFLLSLLVTSIASTGCARSPTAPTVVTGSVQYEVTGTAAHVWINYINATHGSGIVEDSSIPWTYAWSTASTGDRLSLSAFIGGVDALTQTGTLTVTIKKNGTVIATRTATGGLFTTASVDATF